MKTSIKDSTINTEQSAHGVKVLCNIKKNMIFFSAEMFEVMCTCRPLSETAISALNHLPSLKVFHNIEKKQDRF